MDWDKAFTGICFGLEPFDTHSFSERMLTHIWELRLLQRLDTAKSGGQFMPIALKELEPTFENEWDYEWPTDI